MPKSRDFVAGSWAGIWPGLAKEMAVTCRGLSYTGNGPGQVGRELLNALPAALPNGPRF